LVSKLRAAGRKAPIDDSWIAAAAIAHRIPVVTQDNDYDDMPDVEVIKIAVSAQPGSPDETPKDVADGPAEKLGK
jgi:hypothetical protein